MKYTVLKNTTKQAKTIIERYYNATATSLNDVYNNYSIFKARAEKEIKDSMQENGGRGYKIISYCINNFTCGYIGIYEAENGAKYKALYYFTHCNNIVIPLEQLEEATAEAENGKKYDFEEFKKDYDSLNPIIKEKLKDSNIILTSMSQAESLMKASKMFSVLMDLTSK